MRVGLRLPPQLEESESLAALVVGLLGMLADFYARAARTIGPPPPLYSSGVRYATEDSPDGDEEIVDPWTVAKRGKGDCEDLVLYRLVEDRLRGVRSSATIEWMGDQLHVQLRRSDGSIEDPSVILGA
jgi:hypothetical protein